MYLNGIIKVSRKDFSGLIYATHTTTSSKEYSKTLLEKTDIVFQKCCDFDGLEMGSQQQERFSITVFKVMLEWLRMLFHLQLDIPSKKLLFCRISHKQKKRKNKE